MVARAGRYYTSSAHAAARGGSVKEQMLNLSDARTKRTLVRMIERLEGPHRVSIVRWRPRRSDRANAYYFAAVVTPFYHYSRDCGNDMTKEDCHEFLKNEFGARRTWTDPATGEAKEFPARTSKMTTDEFAEYVERCSAWLAELGVFVPEMAT